MSFFSSPEKQRHHEHKKNLTTYMQAKGLKMSIFAPMNNFKKYLLGILATLFLSVPSFAEKTDFFGKGEGVVQGAGNIPTLLAKWDNLTIAEAKSLYTQLAKTEIKGSKLAVTQSSILAEIKASNSLVNPYNFAHSIDDIVLSQDALFVRVHSSWNQNTPWLISVEEFRAFSSQDDMIKKLAVPILDKTGSVVKPVEISIVKLPVGTKVRQSVARPQDWPGQAHQPGGAVQFEIREQQAIPKSWFKPMGNVSDYLN